MALDQSALSDLLDALRSGGDLDFMREAMQLVLQALIDLEAEVVIGAGRYERTEERTTHRNGTSQAHSTFPALSISKPYTAATRTLNNPNVSSLRLSMRRRLRHQPCFLRSGGFKVDCD